MQSKQFEYKVITMGLSSFSNLESFGGRLEACLDRDTAIYEQQGWELWQFDTLNDHQGNNGLISVYRRPKSGY